MLLLLLLLLMYFPCFCSFFMLAMVHACAALRIASWADVAFACVCMSVVVYICTYVHFFLLIVNIIYAFMHDKFQLPTQCFVRCHSVVPQHNCVTNVSSELKCICCTVVEVTVNMWYCTGWFSWNTGWEFAAQLFGRKRIKFERRFSAKTVVKKNLLSRKKV